MGTRWFWVPEWHLAPGEGFETMTLPYPACQLVVEPHGVAVHGPVTRARNRTLTGDGWAVGALLRPGAAHAHLSREFRRILGFTPTDYRDVTR